MSQEQELKDLAEIRRLLDEAYDHYFKHSDGYCKSSEGHISLNFNNYFDRRDNGGSMLISSVEIYSYVFGPSRTHDFRSTAEALETVKEWHRQEMAETYEYDPYNLDWDGPYGSVDLYSEREIGGAVLMFTVIVTGSRDWTDGQAVFRELDRVYQEHGRFGLVVRHGGCRTGADFFAKEWVGLYDAPLGVHEQVHPAQWSKHGSAAGPIRNRAMAQAGADLCLAFPLGESRGTRNCIKECRKQGIPVQVVEAGV